MLGAARCSTGMGDQVRGGNESGRTKSPYAPPQKIERTLSVHRVDLLRRPRGWATVVPSALRVDGSRGARLQGRSTSNYRQLTRQGKSFRKRRLRATVFMLTNERRVGSEQHIWSLLWHQCVTHRAANCRNCAKVETLEVRGSGEPWMLSYRYCQSR